jgi:hypothetical protein
VATEGVDLVTELTGVEDTVAAGVADGLLSVAP